ncbi:thioesterase family protein [Nesterenkonia aurantiaca]|uniref:thioesterase family protein n=1 Tax=Nesterenkonia aurantiaca TaxID=1436010 RepID=UPI003EE6F94B
MVYFQRVSDTKFRATDHASGAWNEAEQHVAPALGLMAHVLERDRDRRRDDDLRIAGLHYDILGPVPVGEVEVVSRVLRPGRTIELVEVELSYGSRAVVLLRGWLLAQFDTGQLQGTELSEIPSPEDLEPWDVSGVWPGGLIRSIEGRRRVLAEGRSQAWIRTPHALVADESVSDVARFIGLFDVANGIAVRADPREAFFPNVELSTQLFRSPEGEWVGYDTTVSFGPDGRGVTHSIVHDRNGPVGLVTQGLTVRPQR